MKCTKCGMELRETDAFCPNCGEPVPKTKNSGNNNEGDIQNKYTYERPSSNQQTSYSQQQGANQQYNYNKPNYGQTQYQQYNNGNNTIKIGMIVVVIIIFVALILGYVLIIKPAQDEMKNTSNNNTISNNSNNQSNEENNSSNKNNNSSINKVSSYKVKLTGFNLFIPDDLIYEVDNVSNAINIGDSESTWLAQILILEGNFDAIKKNKDTIAPYLSELYGTGTEFSNVTIETIGGVECIVFDATMSGVNMTLGIAKVNSMYSAVFVIMNQDNSFDRDRIETVTNIINSAEYVGNTTNMETNNNNVLDGLVNAFNKSLEENQ